PVGYHLVMLAGHLAMAFLLYRLIRKLGVSTAAALAGTGAFVLSIHAHEIIFWSSDTHYAFAGLAVVGAILAYVEGKIWLSLLLTIIALLSDESGVTVLPILAAYEFIFRRSSSVFQDVRQGITQLSAYAAVEVAYVLARLSGGGFKSETTACHSVRCEAL